MAEVKILEKGDTERLLKQLPIELRTKGIRSAVRQAGNVVKKKAIELVPVGDPSHKPDNKPLKDTIKVKVKSYQKDRVWVAIVGAEIPEGAHSHLVEEGHRVRQRGKKGEGPGEFTGAFVPGKKWLAPAVDMTEKKQNEAVIKSLQKTIDKESNG